MSDRAESGGEPLIQDEHHSGDEDQDEDSNHPHNDTQVMNGGEPFSAIGTTPSLPGNRLQATRAAFSGTLHRWVHRLWKNDSSKRRKPRTKSEPVRGIPSNTTVGSRKFAGKGPTGASYNRVVRISAVLFVLLCLAACNRGENKDAVRQGVINHLSKAGLNVSGMDVTVASVQFNGKEADATVGIAPKGNAGQGMSMKYHLQQQGSEWVVVGKPGAGGDSPHGGAMAPATNPHGGGDAAPGGAPTKMPSPEDLPPATKK